MLAWRMTWYKIGNVRSGSGAQDLRMTARYPGERPVLLPMASYHGTLAAVRCLGAAGVRVTLAESSPLVPAVWSRFAARRVRSPSPEDPPSFLQWLMDFGAREPGHVLHPTSDDVAWLYARHRDELAKHFILR